MSLPRSRTWSLSPSAFGVRPRYGAEMTSKTVSREAPIESTIGPSGRSLRPTPTSRPSEPRTRSAQSPGPPPRRQRRGRSRLVRAFLRALEVGAGALELALGRPRPLLGLGKRRLRLLQPLARLAPASLRRLVGLRRLTSTAAFFAAGSGVCFGRAGTRPGSRPKPDAVRSSCSRPRSSSCQSSGSSDATRSVCVALSTVGAFSFRRRRSRWTRSSAPRCSLIASFRSAPFFRRLPPPAPAAAACPTGSAPAPRRDPR